MMMVIQWSTEKKDIMHDQVTDCVLNRYENWKTMVGTKNLEKKDISSDQMTNRLYSD